MVRQVKLVAVVTDSSGNRLSNMYVAFEYSEVNGSPYRLGAVYTDSNGVAEMTISLTPGTYNFSAIFTGTRYFRESRADVIEYVVKDKTTITFNITPL